MADADHVVRGRAGLLEALVPGEALVVATDLAGAVAGRQGAVRLQAASRPAEDAGEAGVLADLGRVARVAGHGAEVGLRLRPVAQLARAGQRRAAERALGLARVPPGHSLETLAGVDVTGQRRLRDRLSGDRLAQAGKQPSGGGRAGCAGDGQGQGGGEGDASIEHRSAAAVQRTTRTAPSARSSRSS